MDNLSFLVSLITDQSDYQREQADTARKAAQRLNVNLQILYADNDAIEQSQQLLEVIQNPSRAVNAVILEPAGATAFPEVARAAATAGIGWAIMNRTDPSIAELRSRYEHPIFSVTTDHEETGRILGRQIAILLPRGGTVLCVQGPSGNPVSEQRLAGMGETKPKNITLKFLRSNYWTEAAGFQAVSSWMRLATSHDADIAGVVAQSDLIALGAYRAFQEQTKGVERDRWLKLPFLGVNGLKLGETAVRSGKLASTVVIPPSTVPAIDMLVRAYREGARPPERTLVAPKPFPDWAILAPRT